MARLVPLCILIVLCAFSNAFSQVDYNTITLCHDKEKKLRSIAIGKYKANLQDARMVSILTTDSSINYDATNQTFTVKNTFDSSHLTLQLTSNGIALRSGDSSKLLNKRSELKTNSILATIQFQPEGSSTVIGSDEFVGACKVGNFSLGIVYRSGRIEEISVPVFNKLLLIKVHKTDVYSWDIYVTENKNTHMLVFKQQNGISNELAIYDDSNNVGIRLFGNQSGFFHTLAGRTTDERGTPVYNFAYRLEYGKNGALKTKHTEFNLDCVSE